MEELGVFDVLGPVMVGPSSNHTGGACRIGIVARSVLGVEPKSLAMGFYSVTTAKSYRGHATDRAIVHGLLGGAVDDVRMRDALKQAKARGLKVSMVPIPPPVPDNNIMRCDILGEDGVRVVVTGLSIGGGSIVIADVDGFPMHLDGNGHVVLVEHDAAATQKVFSALMSSLGAGLLVETVGREGTIPGTHPQRVSGGRWTEVPDTLMSIAQADDQPSQEAIELIYAVPGVVRVRHIPPIRAFFRRTGARVEPVTFEWMMQHSGTPLHERVIEREMARDRKTRDEVVAEMHRLWSVMREAKEIGASGEVDMLCGFDDGLNARRMLEYFKSKKPLAGSTLVRAAAYAIAVNSVNASMGRIVACPTGGASGTLPGALIAAIEAGGLSDDMGVAALFIAGATGAAIGRLCSFAGGVGGCMAEIGFAAAMAAAAIAYLETYDHTATDHAQTAEATSHAAALAIKATMGLICDPPAGPVEVPCIKRNGALVGVALSCAEMAAAGVRSSIPPDEVVIAAKNVQDLMPQTLKNNMDASLGCTETARVMKAKWVEVLVREDGSL